MNTRPDERLPYPELARQGARLVRSVSAGELTRLAEVAPGRGLLEVALEFRLDDQSRTWVSGSVRATVLATCQRCLGEFERVLDVPLDLCVVADQESASVVAGEADVVVADSDGITLAELVEDELILGVPERLCETDPCRHAPVLGEDDAGGEPRRNPFEVLSVLKS